MHEPAASGAALAAVILNPAGANGRAARLRKPLEQALRGGRGELFVTHSPAESQTVAAEATLAGRPVVAVGGDGTIGVIADAMMSAGARSPLGIVPAGTGNDYAYRTINMPRDQRQAIEVALSAPPVAMDVGRVNGRHFLNSLGVGIDANIAAASEELKRLRVLRGQTLYWAASLRELLLHYDRCPRLLVTIDGQVDESHTYALAAINIGPTTGGGFRINPGADPRDGLFDLCILWKPPLLRALRLLPMVEKGTHIHEPEVKRMRARTVALQAEQPVFAHLDGEVITAPSFEVSMLPHALLVRQPGP
ncbi:MAG TPA: diacylglycerol kinase family protein [Ktedonobacterales bacterium]|jgi:YegS/Rv2252/BmrU family lipid kinase